jgi:hypothetical protein
MLKELVVLVKVLIDLLLHFRLLPFFVFKFGSIPITTFLFRSWVLKLFTVLGVIISDVFICLRLKKEVL